MLDQLINAIKRHPNTAATFSAISTCLAYRHTSAYSLVCRSVIGSYLAHKQINWLEAELARAILKGVPR